jgi:GNAT superfamily N-acetyltransferase
MDEYTKFLKYLLYCGFSPAQEFSSPHCFAMKSGSNLAFCNRVGGTSEISDEEIFDVSTRYFDSVPFRWFVDAQDKVQIKKLLDNQFIHVVSYPGMILELKNLAPHNYNDAIAITEIHDAKDIKQWIDIIAKSYGLNGDEFIKFIAYLRANCPPNSLQFYTAFYEANPIATTMTIQHKDIVGVHWVGTVPEYRGKGIGYAITYQSLIDAKKNHASKAILMASELGKPVYTKMGFNVFATYEVYKRS